MVWIGGNGPGDSHIMKFTQDGKFVAQYGKPNARMSGKNPQGQPTFTPGSSDPESFGRVAKIFVEPEGQRGLRRRRLLQPPRRGARRHHRQDEAVLGRLRQAARRHRVARALQSGCAAVPALPQPGALRRRVERRPRLRLRPRQRSPPGVQARRHVRPEVFIAKNTKPSGSVWDVAFSKDPQQRYLFVADGMNNRIYILQRDTHAGADQLRRRRPPARPVLRRAQHRHRLAGQPLHDRDVGGETACRSSSTAAWRR